jgi:ABC-type polysaccharide/polyol phosphate export permease
MDALTAPDPALRWRRPLSLSRTFVELFQMRSLIYRLAERDIRARYKRAMLGMGWAVITPLILTATFSLVIKHITTVETHGVPYSVFVYMGLVPWTLFSAAVADGAACLLSNSAVLGKVRCPRAVFPMASVAVAAFDFCITFALGFVLMAIQQYAPRATSPFVLLYLAIELVWLSGLVLILAGIVVYVRDLRYLIPITLQAGLFVTPVAVGFDRIAPSLRTLYVVVNPLAEVIDGIRRALLYGQGPDWPLTLAAGASALGMLVVGSLVIQRLEVRIADVA